MGRVNFLFFGHNTVTGVIGDDFGHVAKLSE